MSGVTNLTPFPLQPLPSTAHATRPVLWSIRRELWENRSLYIAPLVVAVFTLLGFPFSLASIVDRRRGVGTLTPSEQVAAVAVPFDGAAMLLLVTGLAVALFYCVDALYGERRDRSILFWKSLPVSDGAAVLAKVAIPMVVLPAITFALIVATQVVMLLVMSIALLIGGVSPATTWAHANPFAQPLILLYGIAANALWHAPLFAWLLLVSAWARRAVVVWATVPFFAYAAIERIFDQGALPDLLRHRIVGAIGLAFDYRGQGTVYKLSQLTPLRFLTAPGLWVGLVLAAVFLAGAVRLRQQREPI